MPACAVARGSGATALSGGQGDGTLNGQDDNDLLNGGAGNDILDGGVGDDTAVFSGAAGDYVWSGDSHSATITGPDGTDTLIDVEHLKFGSTVIDLPAPNTALTAPADGDAAANMVSEGAAAGTVVAGLTLASTDPDADQTLTWSLLDDAGGRFAIDAETGVVTVADGSKRDFETAASHQITAQVSDEAAVASASFTIQVANVAVGAPTDSNAVANTISEAAANGTAVSGLAITAADPNDGVTYSPVDDAGGRFAINAATGVVTVADASLIDFDAASSHQITVRATGGQGVFSSQTFTIAIANVANGAPQDDDTAANTISEGALHDQRRHRRGDGRQRQPAELRGGDLAPSRRPGRQRRGKRHGDLHHRRAKRRARDALRRQSGRHHGDRGGQQRRRHRL